MVLPTEQSNYLANRERNKIKSYGNALTLPKGEAFYLPKYEQYYEESLGDIIKGIFTFINSNKDNIKNIAESVSSVGNAASSITKNIIDVKNAASSGKSISEKDKDAIIGRSWKLQSGNGFSIVN